MAIMAQEWVDENRYRFKGEFIVKAGFEPYLSIVQSIMERENHLHPADFLVFDECLDGKIVEFVENKQITTEIIFKNVRMPDDVWIEFKNALDKNTKTGLLFFTMNEPYVALFFSEGKRTYLLSISQIQFTEEDPFVLFSPVILEKVYAVGNSIDKGAQQHVDFIYSCMIPALFGLFMTQQPKLIEEIEVKHPDALQNARRKRGKHPLLEYKRVNITIGKPEKRYINGAENESDGENKHRYHKVLGHFREREYKPGGQRVHWVRPHHRGDPKLGVIFKEHHVKFAKSDEQ